MKAIIKPAMAVAGALELNGSSSDELALSSLDGKDGSESMLRETVKPLPNTKSGTHSFCH